MKKKKLFHETRMTIALCFFFHKVVSRVATKSAAFYGWVHNSPGMDFGKLPNLQELASFFLQLLHNNVLRVGGSFFLSQSPALFPFSKDYTLMQKKKIGKNISIHGFQLAAFD